LSILALILFFIVGGLVLRKVDVNQGINVAREEDRNIVQIS
jgi:hypothetical protein